MIKSAGVPWYTYSLGRTLYVPITCRSNSRTLPETRGPGFTLPSHVVASLCRFRDLECQNQTWSHWCNWLDWQDTQQHLPEPVPMVTSLTASSSDVIYNEAIEELLKAEIEMQLQKTTNNQQDNIDHDSYYTDLKFGGEGEPILNLKLLESLSRTFRDQIPTIIVMTNGLMPTLSPPTTETTTTDSSSLCIPSALKEWGVSGVSVAFPTHDPIQYNILMKATSTNEDTTKENDNAHERLCSFIRSALACNLQVELTAVDRPDVNKVKTQEFATKLGVPTEVRWRPYFP